ncbi:uncharacterized protein F4822DRAFT_423331 [Hypoxylon trugodes]|uniref:uncharacterized protein n=1 Tax=Hypoxylon trugodes TaxID=326681 RepID=UPI0021A0DF05|nr:uncharacterized protein F4822DRAFT_423331 [Hypoxylon trugodes]KAI1382722.1 hypothetical protein F4822DRAFT_423331 [Hypoxylon trugodes]
MGFNSTNIPPEVLAALPAELQAQAPLYDQTAQPKIYATLAVCTVIAYVALGLRLYARRITKQAFGLDDVFTSLAVVFTTISVGLLAYLASLGMGRHEIVIVLEHIEDFDVLNKTLIASSAMYLPVIFCIKASAIFLYRRVFPNRRFHIVCYIILTFTALYALTAILVLTISCLPALPPTAEEPVAQLKCADNYLINTLLVILITNVVLDAIILCLPLPLIWQLQTTLRKKLQLTLVFTLGSFIFIISIIRVVAVKRLNPLDDNWDSTDVELWSIAESAVAIITVSLPVMQPVLRQVVYRKDGSSRITLAPNTNSHIKIPNGSSNNRPIALLTFGRSGMKGPSGRRPQELDVTTTATITVVDTNFDASATRLVAEDYGSSNRAHIKPWEDHRKSNTQP